MANYPGDSGAPIITIENNVAKIAGLHVASPCMFKHNTDFAEYYMDVRNSTTYCMKNHSDEPQHVKNFYKVFST